MLEGLPRVEVDFARLEEHLKVLSHANRLELLSLLRRPRTLDEIRLTPSGPQAGATPDRPITRQAVQNHLNQLVEAGLVRVAPTSRRDTRSIHEYAVDHTRLFAVVEELRKLSTLQSVVPLDPLATMDLRQPDAGAWEEGPKLVLVHGVHEGLAYPLREKDLPSGRGWVVGRAAEAQVRIEFDPYVSAENAEVLRSGPQWRLLDLRTAKNRVVLNWQPLPVGGEAQLRSGDVIGVGQSLLVFRPE